MGNTEKNTNIDFDHHYHQLQLVQQRVMNGKRKITESICQIYSAKYEQFCAKNILFCVSVLERKSVKKNT